MLVWCRSSSTVSIVRTRRRYVAERTLGFTESVIREMTRLADLYGAINLAQGFPDFAAPDEIKEAAVAAIRADVNQYAITWGARALREALADAYRDRYAMRVDPDTMITIACGATEAMIASLLAIIDPGDEVIVFEPFYENYGPDATLCGARPVFVPLRPPDFTFDRDELAAGFTPRTKAIIVNTPNNPTGRVFTSAELEAIAEQCRRHDVIAVTDEIYEHIVYEGQHRPIATLDEMADRTITISGFSKTFSVTGWRVGTIVAASELTAAIRKVHDFLTVGAPAPLQQACAMALRLGQSYYERLASEYRARRDRLHAALAAAGFHPRLPEGAYYLLCDISHTGFADDVAFARWLVEKVGVAGVPGSAFFSRPELGRGLIRFTFCKRPETLDAAAARLAGAPRLAHST